MIALLKNHLLLFLYGFRKILMKLNSFSPLPEDDEELHLPELVYWASLGDVEQVEQLLAEG
jgi:hypothetical protein